MRFSSNICALNATKLWTASSVLIGKWINLMAASSYPQIQKVIHKLWESPKSTLNLARYLTRRVRSTLSTRAPQGASSRRVLLSGVLCLAWAIPSPTWASSITSKDNYKLYLHSRVVSDSQYQCAYKLYMKESRFDSRAVNGSHYGIPQLRNKKLKHLDGYTQIDWGIRYIAHRYKGDYCLAWKHFKDKGWH
jgi:hypothetical protein